MTSSEASETVNTADARRPGTSASLRAPLMRPLFRMLWIASMFSAIGSWMHDSAASWFMTSLAPSPAVVALVQTATQLPSFFLALPAGALADIIDRRRYLMVAQSWMMLSALGLGLLTLFQVTDASLLLLFTFFMGIGAAMSMPAFSAVLPDLVPRQELLGAVTLNAVAVNVTRAIGPALGGFLIGLIGPGGIFLINAVTFAGMLYVVSRLPRPKRTTTLPSERLLGAIRVGMRFAVQSPVLRRVVVRGCLFYFAAVVILALMPVFVRGTLHGSASTYGLMLSAFGLGAVSGALAIPRLSHRLKRDQILTGGMLVFALTLPVFAFAENRPLLLLSLFVLGMAWIFTLSSLQMATQTALPIWVRARGLAIFLMTLMGCMAAGSAFWGSIAHAFSLQTAYLAAAAVILISTLAFRHLSVETEGLDLSPGERLPDPSLAMPIDGERGPVLAMIEYRVRPENWDAFRALMPELRQARRRNGAYSWSLFQDVERPERFTETFLDESWLEHLRHHHRITVADEAILNRVRELHDGDEPPVVTHSISQALPNDSLLDGSPARDSAFK